MRARLTPTPIPPGAAALHADCSCNLCRPLCSPLCGLCRDDLVQLGTSCVECLPNWLNAFILAVALLLVVGGAVYLIRSSSKRRSALSSLSRICINYLQIVSKSNAAAHPTVWCAHMPSLTLLAPPHVRNSLGQNTSLGGLNAPMPPAVNAAFGVQSVGDGVSFDLAPLQCLFKVRTLNTPQPCNQPTTSPHTLPWWRCVASDNILQRLLVLAGPALVRRPLRRWRPVASVSLRAPLVPTRAPSQGAGRLCHCAVGIKAAQSRPQGAQGVTFVRHQ